MAQVLCIKNVDCAVILTYISKLKEELLELKVGLHKMGQFFGLDLFPPDPVLDMKVPILIPTDEDDCKSDKDTWQSNYSLAY